MLMLLQVRTWLVHGESRNGVAATTKGIACGSGLLLYGASALDIWRSARGRRVFAALLALLPSAMRGENTSGHLPAG